MVLHMERGKGGRLIQKILTLQVLRAVTDRTYVILLNIITFVQSVLSRGFKARIGIMEYQ
jgi:hypothetical protein